MSIVEALPSWSHITLGPWPRAVTRVGKVRVPGHDDESLFLRDLEHLDIQCALETEVANVERVGKWA